MAIAPSTYYAHRAMGLVSRSDWDDAHTANRLFDLWRANRRLYGATKLWAVALDGGLDVGRDQVGRLMRIVGIEGVRRGKHTTVTTRRDPTAARHPDLIRRDWGAPVRPD
ncbi:MAG: IS3 family transposase, partial [Acidimicrobiales bacterium]